MSRALYKSDKEVNIFPKKRLLSSWWRNYLLLCSRFPLKAKYKDEDRLVLLKNLENTWKKKKNRKWRCFYRISCSARSPCRGDALAPAAPTFHSSQSNWQSSWPESLSAGARRGSLSPPRCQGPTARLWSSSAWLGWPTIHTGAEQGSLTQQTD